jgi:hypothetical protein
VDGLINATRTVLHLLTQQNYWMRVGVAAIGTVSIIIGMIILIRKPVAKVTGAVGKVL